MGEAAERINPDLVGFAVDIDSVRLDPKNPRQHPERSIREIAASLRAYGQQKPVVIDRAGKVIAGNGTVSAARKLGWKRIAAVRFQSDDDLEALGYKVADNRTAEFATWEPEILAGILRTAEGQPMGFNAEEIRRIFDMEWSQAGDQAPPDRERPPELSGDSVVFAVAFSPAEMVEIAEVFKRARESGVGTTQREILLAILRAWEEPAS